MTASWLPWSSTWLALRSLLWTILLPGVVAGYVPWRFFGLGRLRFKALSPAHLLGLFCIGVGTVLLVACIWEFARRGGGRWRPSIRLDVWSFAASTDTFATPCISASRRSSSASCF